MDVSGPGPVPNPLARLEARVRWLTALSSFLTLGFVALLIWQFAPRPKVVEAHSFVLRDESWRRRGELGLREDGSPLLRLNDASGKARLMIYARDDGQAGMRLLDGETVSRARFGLEPDGKPILLLAGADGRSRVLIAPLGEGYSGMELHSPDRKLVWKAP
jgi:hypothetical protein